MRRDVAVERGIARSNPTGDNCPDLGFVLFRKNRNTVGHGRPSPELHDQTHRTTAVRMWDSFCFVESKCRRAAINYRNCTIRPNPPTSVRIRDSLCFEKFKMWWDPAV